MVTVVLCGGFVFAVWYLRRDGQAASAQQSVLATIKAVIKRRQASQEEQRQRLRRGDITVEHAPGAIKVDPEGKGGLPASPSTIGFGGVGGGR